MECGIIIVWYPKQCDSLNFREKWYSISYKISNIIISRFQVKKILISIPGNEFLSWGIPPPHLCNNYWMPEKVAPTKNMTIPFRI